jgi:hypothetical protein
MPLWRSIIIPYLDVIVPEEPRQAPQIDHR